MSSRTDQTTTRATARAVDASRRPGTSRPGITALAVWLLAGSIVTPIVGAASAAWAQDAPRGEQSGEEEPPAQGRRDRGGRGAMPLPPDWPRAGGFGTRERGLIEGLVAGDVAGADLSRREITDEELARALKVAARVSEDWGRTLAARAEQDPAQLKAALRTTGRRLFALLVLEERAPRLFEAKIAELRAQGETARAAEALKRAEEQPARAGDAGAPAEAPKQAPKDDVNSASLRAALDAAIARQIETTLAVRREELVAIEARIAEMRGAIERDAADPAAIAEEIRTRALSPRQPEGRTVEGRDGEDRRGPRDDRRGPRDPQVAPRGADTAPPASPPAGK